MNELQFYGYLLCENEVPSQVEFYYTCISSLMLMKYANSYSVRYLTSLSIGFCNLTTGKRPDIPPLPVKFASS